MDLKRVRNRRRLGSVAQDKDVKKEGTQQKYYKQLSKDVKNKERTSKTETLQRMIIVCGRQRLRLKQVMPRNTNKCMVKYMRLVQST